MSLGTRQLVEHGFQMPKEVFNLFTIVGLFPHFLGSAGFDH